MRAPVVITVRFRGGRVNPLHPEGAQLFNRQHLIYVVDTPREMWAIFAPRQLPGWYPGVRTRIFVQQGGNEYHVTVRGIVELDDVTASGDVANVPVRSCQFVNVR